MALSWVLNIVIYNNSYNNTSSLQSNKQEQIRLQGSQRSQKRLAMGQYHLLNIIRIMVVSSSSLPLPEIKAGSDRLR